MGGPYMAYITIALKYEKRDSLLGVRNQLEAYHALTESRDYVTIGYPPPKKERKKERKKEYLVYEMYVCVCPCMGCILYCVVS